MNLINHEPVVKTFVNGFQITFENLYTLVVKIGPGTATTQTKDPADIAEQFLASRFGGNSSSNCEVEIYSPSKENITSKFSKSNESVLGFVTTMELANLFYIVSSLKKYDNRKI